jgi:hypothetical protein
MKPCRECRHPISEQSLACPQCGAPYPARNKWDGWGFEYKSDLAIGQFACGGLCISQFGIGLVSISQFTVAGCVLAQFRVYVAEGHGRLLISLEQLLALL